MKFNLDFKSILKSTLIKKNSSCTLWRQPWIKRNLNFSQVAEESVNIIISKDFQISMLLSTHKEVVVCPDLFSCQKCLCKGEQYDSSLISHAFKLTVNDAELSMWEDEDVTFNIPYAWRFPAN